MRPLVRILSVIGLAAAIADRGAAMADNDIDSLRYKRMEAEAMSSLAAFPGQLSAREIRLSHRNISQFCDKMGWDHKNLHAQTLLNFSSEQLESVRCELVAHNADRKRIEAVEKLIDVEAGIYERYAAKEYPLCAMAGRRASVVWEEIWSR